MPGWGAAAVERATQTFQLVVGDKVTLDRATFVTIDAVGDYNGTFEAMDTAGNGAVSLEMWLAHFEKHYKKKESDNDADSADQWLKRELHSYRKGAEKESSALQAAAALEAASHDRSVTAHDWDTLKEMAEEVYELIDALGYGTTDSDSDQGGIRKAELVRAHGGDFKACSVPPR